MVEKLSVTPELTRLQMEKAFGPELEFDKELSRFTTFKTGGPARYFFKVKSAESASNSIKTARQLQIPFFLVGGGSNLLISDLGFEGLILKVDVKGLKLIDSTEILSGAGEDLMSLVDFSADNSLTGLEFASGIFGSVGGAIYGNAGAYGGEIGNIVKEITLVEQDGNIKKVDAKYCEFEYRGSLLKQTKEVVIDTLFELSQGEKTEIKANISEILAIREKKHPVGGNSAGSFFKNIPDPKEKHGKLPAGKLLEEVGCKGLKVGGAQVFEKHANIIVNAGGATSSDIRKLADIMKQRVSEKFGIILEEEVIQVGRF
jgi:UDP-N-acetylmuramate dehydrogenase